MMNKFKNFWLIFLWLSLLSPALAGGYYPGPQAGGGGGSSAAASTAGAVRLSAATQARGSTNTYVHRFDTTDSNVGGVFTVSDSATLGTTIEVGSDGWYMVSGAAAVTSGSVGIKTAASLNNNFNASDTDYAIPYNNGAAGAAVGGLVYLSASDLVWVVSSGTLQSNPGRDFFAIYGPLPIAS